LWNYGLKYNYELDIFIESGTLTMRAVVQRVKKASVTVDGKVVGLINAGLLVYLGIGKGDEESDAVFISDKIVNLRIFQDSETKNESECQRRSRGCPYRQQLYALRRL
jgi:hypothetical protein